MSKCSLIICLALSVCFVKGFSQDSLKVKPRFNFISFNVGASFATGKYAASNSTSEGSGFAASGLHYQFEYAGFWNKNAGFGFEAGRFSNSVNQYAFQSNFNDYYAANMLPVSKVTVPSVGSWTVYYLMAGPYVTLPFKNLFIDFKALGGVVNSSSPDFSYVTQSNNNKVDATSTASSTFGYILGSNIRLKVSKNAQLKFGIEYFQTYASSGFNISSGGNYSWGTQSISTLNLTWGIALILGK